MMTQESSLCFGFGFQLHGIPTGEVRVRASEPCLGSRLSDIIGVRLSARLPQICVGTILRLTTLVDEGLGIQDAR